MKKMAISEILSKIKFDPREAPEDYSLFYYDRIADREIEVRYPEILRVEGGHLFLMKGGKEVQIPIHRVRKVKKKGQVVWSR